MAIVAEKKEVSQGVWKTTYVVVAEAINRYTGKRVQKKRRGILSKTKAQLIYKELWSACREHRPDNANFTFWKELLIAFSEHIEAKQRSPENPLGLSPHTVKCKRSRLTHTDEWSDLHIDLITPAFVTDSLDAMERKGMSRQHTNEVLKEVKCAFAYGVFTGALKSNPFAGMKMRKAVKRRLPALNQEEVNVLLQEARSRSHPYYYVWLLSIALGARRSELAGLKWTDVDFKQNLIHLQRQFIPREGEVSRLKDWEERTIAIPSGVVPTLKEMKLKAESEFVIELDCQSWREGSQAKVLRAFCKEIGIKEITHHRLRATHITLALESDVPLAIVKENVGHAQLSTTDKYFSNSGIKMRGQMDRLRIQVPTEEGATVLPLNAARQK